MLLGGDDTLMRCLECCTEALIPADWGYRGSSFASSSSIICLVHSCIQGKSSVKKPDDLDLHCRETRLCDLCLLSNLGYNCIEEMRYHKPLNYHSPSSLNIFFSPQSQVMSSKLAPQPDRLPISVQEEWNGYEHDGQESQQAARPINTKAVVHGVGEQRKCGSKRRPD